MLPMFQKCLAPKKKSLISDKNKRIVVRKKCLGKEEHVSKIVASSKKMRKTHNTKKKWQDLDCPQTFTHLERHSIVKVFYSSSFLCNDKPIKLRCPDFCLKNLKVIRQFLPTLKYSSMRPNFHPSLAIMGLGGMAEVITSIALRRTAG